MFPLVLITPQTKSSLNKLAIWQSGFPNCRPLNLHAFTSALPVTVATIAALIFLTACDSDNAQFSDGEFSLNPPQRIRNISAIDLNNVIAIATVNDSAETKQYTMTLAGNDSFRTDIDVAPDSTIRISMEFSENFTNGSQTARLILARHPPIDVQMNGTNQTARFFDADYNTAFDRDRDGITNIDERNLGTDPLVFSPIGPTTRTINVSFILPPVVPNPNVTQVIAIYAEAPKLAVRAPSSNRFDISGTVPTSLDIPIEVNLIQDDDNGQRVLLARANSFVTAGSDNRNIQLGSNDFNFNQDPDGDGRFNVEEIRQGTNPFIAD